MHPATGNISPSLAQRKSGHKGLALMPAVAGSRRDGFFTFPNRRPQFGNGRFPAQKTPGNVK